MRISSGALLSSGSKRFDCFFFIYSKYIANNCIVYNVIIYIYNPPLYKERKYLYRKQLNSGVRWCRISCSIPRPIQLTCLFWRKKKCHFRRVCSYEWINRNNAVIRLKSSTPPPHHPAYTRGDAEKSRLFAAHYSKIYVFGDGGFYLYAGGCLYTQKHLCLKVRVRVCLWYDCFPYIYTKWWMCDYIVCCFSYTYRVVVSYYIYT